MKRAFLAIAILILAVPAFAQKIGKPTKDGKEPTPAQREIINQGIRLHDEKRYDEAIAQYNKVLAESPDCVLALYEVAYSHYAKKDLDNSLRFALKAAEYRSDILPRVYMMIANVVDDKGEPEKAIKIYEEAIKQNPDLAVLRYNIAITYFRLKKLKEARAQAKKAVELDFAYPSPHYILAVHFSDSGYKVPSLLAGLRFLSLEADTPRAKSAAALIAQKLESGATRNKESGNINIFVDLNSPKDEGDFSTIDLILSMRSAMRIGGDDEKDEKPKTREEQFVETLEMLVNSVAEDDENGKTFTGKNYFGYFREMKAKDYTKVLGHLVLAQIGSDAAMDWLGKNQQDLLAFWNWSKAFNSK